MASHSRYGKNPATSSEDISIPISFPENEQHSSQYPSSESPLTRHINPAPISKPNSRLAEHTGSMETTLKKLIAQKSTQSRFKQEHGSSQSELAEPLLKEEKTTPNESQIYEKITAQLNARNRRQKVVNSLFNLIVLGGILGMLISSLTIERFKGQEFYRLEYWKWLVLLLAIFSGLLITNWVVSFIVFLIEWKYLMKKNVVYFTHGLKDNVKVFIWLGVILGTWECLVRPDIKRTDTDAPTDPDTEKKIEWVLHFITLTLLALVLGSFLWLLKTAMMKFIASCFSLNRYFDRINQGIFQNYVLQSLSGRPLYDEKFKDGEVDLGNKDGEEKVDYAKLHKLKKDKTSFSTVQMLTNVLSGSGMHTMSDMLNKKVVEGGVELDDDEITSEEEATAIAYKIFCNIVGPGNHHRKSIDEHDLLKFILPEELKIVYPLFDADESKSISLQEFCAAVVKMHKDRSALQLAMNDNKTAVNQLDNIVKTIMLVLIFVFWLIITELAPTKVLVFMSSQLVVAAFIFGNTCKNVFEAIIFVFVTHPFDVGDRCVIDGAVMAVEEMKLLTTVFLKFGEKVYYPNNILATKCISNYFRSPNQGEAIEFTIDYRTTLETIALLKERIEKYVNENPKWWQANPGLAVKEIQNVNALKMSLVVFHTCNFQNTKQVKKSKYDLFLHLKDIFDDLHIKYHLLPQEVHLRNTTTNF